MSTKFYYNNKEFLSIEDAEAEVVVVYNKLENNPTEWCIVKEITGNANDGWNIPAETMTDTQILNLNPSKTYSITSTISGDNHVGLNAGDTTTKISEFRTLFAQYIKANEILKREIITPSSHDMSGYI